MTRRPIIRVIVFLLLGAITNLAVAWLAVWFESTASGHLTGQLADSEVEYVVARHGYSTIIFTGEGTLLALRITDPDFRLAEPLDERVRTLFSCIHRDDFAIGGSGWPFLSLRWHCGRDRRVAAGIVIEPKPRRLRFENGTITYPTMPSKILPLRPIWPDFAINTIFYAAVLWIVFAAAGSLKRIRRRRRGRCLHCGYDLRGQPPDSSKCPECGQNAFDR